MQYRLKNSGLVFTDNMQGSCSQNYSKKFQNIFYGFNDIL